MSGYSRTHHTFHALSSGRHPRNHVHDSLTASPPLSCFADSAVYFRYLIVHCSVQILVFPYILIKPPQHLPMPLQTTKDHTTNQRTSTLPSEQKFIPVTMVESPMILLGEDNQSRWYTKSTIILSFSILIQSGCSRETRHSLLQSVERRKTLSLR